MDQRESATDHVDPPKRRSEPQFNNVRYIVQGANGSSYSEMGTTVISLYRLIATT